MKYPLICSILFGILSFKLALADCIEYEPKRIELTGTLVREITPGRPNYESIKNGDEKVTIWVLKLNTPICVTESDEINVKEENETEVQLVLNRKLFDKYKTLINTKVSIKGQLFHSHTGHHYKKLLLKANEIKN